MPRLLSLDINRVRPPAHPMRETVDDDYLEQLAASIRDVGILQPLRVKALAEGEYEVVVGHCRLLAARIAGLATLPCILHGDGQTTVAAKVHENLLRRDVSPAEEALYYAELYGELGEDVDKVAAAVRRPREYVERRMLLLRGDPKVLEALKAGNVSVGQAEQLNRLKRPEDRAYYLEYTMRAGASIRQLREWVGQANARAELAAASPAPAAPPADPPGTPAPAGPLYASMAKPWEFSSSVENRTCMFCSQPQQEFRMYRQFVCEPCANRHLVPKGLLGAPTDDLVRS